LKICQREFRNGSSPGISILAKSKVHLVLNLPEPERSKVRVRGCHGDYSDLDIEVETKELRRALDAGLRGPEEALVINKAKHMAIVGHNALLFLMLVAYPLTRYTYLIDDLSKAFLDALEDTNSSADRTNLNVG
jgi:hypothetical protein